jgi:hypothetical protein
MQAHLEACEARLALDQRNDPPGDLAAALKLGARRMSASR